MYHKFIGIDIGKQDFYLAIHGNSQVTKYNNTVDGFKKMKKTLDTELKNSLVVLENTGGYEAELVKYLLSMEIKVHRADTRKAKSFIHSTGRLKPLHTDSIYDIIYL